MTFESDHKSHGTSALDVTREVGSSKPQKDNFI